jgi:hypothetical protein
VDERDEKPASDKTTSGIDQLVEQLNSLHEGERIFAQLTAIGSPAIRAGI